MRMKRYPSLFPISNFESVGLRHRALTKTLSIKRFSKVKLPAKRKSAFEQLKNTGNSCRSLLFKNTSTEVDNSLTEETDKALYKT